MRQTIPQARIIGMYISLSAQPAESPATAQRSQVARWVQQKSGELHLIRRVIRPGRGHLTSTNLTHVDFPPTLRSGSATFLLFETLSTRTVHRTVSWMCHVVRWDIDCDSHPSSRPAGTAARVIRGLSSTPYRSWVQRPPRTGDVGDDTLQAMGRIGKVVSTLIGHARRVAGLNRIEIPPLVQFHLNGIDTGHPADPPNGPPTRKSMVVPNLEPMGLECTPHRAGHLGGGTASALISQIDIDVEIHPEAV